MFWLFSSLSNLFMNLSCKIRNYYLTHLFFHEAIVEDYSEAMFRSIHETDGSESTVPNNFKLSLTILYWILHLLEKMGSFNLIVKDQETSMSEILTYIQFWEWIILSSKEWMNKGVLSNRPNFAWTYIRWFDRRLAEAICMREIRVRVHSSYFLILLKLILSFFQRRTRNWVTTCGKQNG